MFGAYAADFDYVKSKVDQQAQPWFDGWNKLLESDGAKLTWTARPQEEIIRTSSGGNFNTAAFERQQLINWL